MIIIFVLAALCSWEDSLKVREFVSKPFSSVLSKHGIGRYTLPESCPLRNPEKADVLAQYYSYKKKQSNALHECTSCSKQFRSEKALEDHIVRNHAKGDGTCLGDFCQFLPCGRHDEVAMKRCENVMSQCFETDAILDALDLCKHNEDTIWDLELETPGYIIITILVVVGCFIYYLLLWADMEEKHTTRRYKKKIN
jgi:C2H2-type zinc finger